MVWRKRTKTMTMGNLSNRLCRSKAQKRTLQRSIQSLNSKKMKRDSRILIVRCCIPRWKHHLRSSLLSGLHRWLNIYLPKVICRCFQCIQVMQCTIKVDCCRELSLEPWCRVKPFIFRFQHMSILCSTESLPSIPWAAAMAILHNTTTHITVARRCLRQWSWVHHPLESARFILDWWKTFHCLQGERRAF